MRDPRQRGISFPLTIENVPYDSIVTKATLKRGSILVHRRRACLALYATSRRRAFHIHAAANHPNRSGYRANRP